jgi:hypothetical protein
MKLDGIGIDPFAVLEAASESILVTDADIERPGPIIVYANPAFERRMRLNSPFLHEPCYFAVAHG